MGEEKKFGEKLSRADKKFRETQAMFARVAFAEPLLLMVGLLRLTLEQTTVLLDRELAALGLSLHERDALYTKIRVWREAKEAELYGDGAYEGLRAQARVMGLLDRPALTAGSMTQLTEAP